DAFDVGRGAAGLRRETRDSRRVDLGFDQRIGQTFARRKFNHAHASSSILCSTRPLRQKQLPRAGRCGSEAYRSPGGEIFQEAPLRASHSPVNGLIPVPASRMRVIRAVLFWLYIEQTIETSSRE